MNHVEVTLYFHNELRLKSRVEQALADDGMNLEDKLSKEHFAFLYDQLVPRKAARYPAEIEQIEAQENAEREPVANSVSSTFMRTAATDTSNELFDSLLSTAYRYRLCDRGELGFQPEMMPKPSARWSISVPHSIKNSVTECLTTTRYQDRRHDYDLDETATNLPKQRQCMVDVVAQGCRRAAYCQPTVALPQLIRQKRKNSKKPSQARKSSYPKETEDEAPTRG